MDSWDVALLVIAGYVATMALIRVMIRRRDQLVEEFRRGMEAEKRRKTANEQQQDEQPQREAA